MYLVRFQAGMMKRCERNSHFQSMAAIVLPNFKLDWLSIMKPFVKKVLQTKNFLVANGLKSKIQLTFAYTSVTVSDRLNLLSHMYDTVM